MLRVQEQKKRHAEYVQSDEYRQLKERHLNWLREHGYPPEVIAKYEGPWDVLPRTRKRRGKIVEIPPEWQGVVTHPQTIRKRASKLTGKARRRIKARNAKKEASSRC